MSELNLSLAYSDEWIAWQPGQVDAGVAAIRAREDLPADTRERSLIAMADNDDMLAALDGIHTGSVWVPDGELRGQGYVRTYPNEGGDIVSPEKLVKELKKYKRARGERIFDRVVERAEDAPIGPCVAEIMINATRERPYIVTSVTLWLLPPDSPAICVVGSTVFPEHDEQLVEAVTALAETVEIER